MLKLVIKYVAAYYRKIHVYVDVIHFNIYMIHVIIHNNFKGIFDIATPVAILDFAEIFKVCVK